MLGKAAGVDFGIPHDLATVVDAAGKAILVADKRAQVLHRSIAVEESLCVAADIGSRTNDLPAVVDSKRLARRVAGKPAQVLNRSAAIEKGLIVAVARDLAVVVDAVATAILAAEAQGLNRSAAIYEGDGSLGVGVGGVGLANDLPAVVDSIVQLGPG